MLAPALWKAMTCHVSALHKPHTRTVSLAGCCVAMSWAVLHTSLPLRSLRQSELAMPALCAHSQCNPPSWGWKELNLDFRRGSRRVAILCLASSRVGPGGHPMEEPSAAPLTRPSTAEVVVECCLHR